MLSVSRKSMNGLFICISALTSAQASDLAVGEGSDASRKLEC